MAIGKRIRMIRNLRGMTQKELGISIGFDEKTSDVRIAQYEAETRIPKENLVTAIAGALQVSTQALDVPEIDSYLGVIHTLFALEDLYGLTINNVDGALCLTLAPGAGMNFVNMTDMFAAWQQEAEKLKNGDITKEEYDQWRYNYPRNDVHWRSAGIDLS